jgi:uncharacterized LabA/DUF88 family protein
MNNFAFIDSQNLNLGIQRLGWKLDYRKFRIYLSDKYNVRKAYLFLGYLPENQSMYSKLQEYGYVLIFKPVVINHDGDVKGNVDADLVLQAMIDFDKYDKAVLITSDGDFQCLVRYLKNNEKLELVMSPYVKTCSVLLRKAAKEKLVFMDNLMKKLEYIRKSTA